MDNGPSHTAQATRAWIAAHPRITVTYTPKHASWLDMAELWFSALTRALLRRGEFTSPADLADKITAFAIRYNRTARPWAWAYDARADHAERLSCPPPRLRGRRARRVQRPPRSRMTTMKPGTRTPQELTRACTRTARTGGLDQHVQGGAQVGVGVDDVRPGAGVVAALLGPFRHRSQRLPGRNERGLQRDADVTVGRAHTRPPTREHQDGCRTRPKASARGTARVGSRFPRTSPSRSSPDPRPRRTRGHLRPPRRGP